jgi:hypothetical protein
MADLKVDYQLLDSTERTLSSLTGTSRLKTEQAALMRDALAEQQRRTGSTAPDTRE